LRHRGRLAGADNLRPPSVEELERATAVRDRSMGMVRYQRWAGLELAGFGIAGVLLGILASAAAPPPVPNRIAVNEAAAIDALRRIAGAQERLQAAADVETNCDGLGEYGFFAELGGTVPMRVSVACVPAAGGPADMLSPPLLRSALGTVTEGCVLYRGYLFQMWLADATWNGRVLGVREDGSGGCQAGGFPDPVNGARLWCCYAWPLDYNHSGKRAFFINQRGAVLEYSNRSLTPWSGRSPSWSVPYFDEAYSVPDDMGSPLRIGIPNASGSVWWPVR
jgi:hypothetical protein